MKEQYQKLFHLIEKANDDKSFKLEDVLREAVAFFDGIRMAYMKASKEEKEELLHMMNGLYRRLQETSKQIGEKVGMSEEGLKDYSENPNNFSPEQWKFLQESKNKLHGSVKALSKDLGVKSAKAATVARPKRSKVIRKRNWA
ncbi:MAG TPA: hypothetical protein VLG76_02100 [Rhabdochlamydiaceae bacterium]|nr:hypothetical protein [Rhabdochlamydiaceae bacterium]